MNDQSSYRTHLSVGIVQTTVDAKRAWRPKAACPQMSDVQDEHAWAEIRKAFRAFTNSEQRPEVVVFPELSLPRTRIREFERLVCGLNAITIAGADYRLDHSAKGAWNEGMVFVPGGIFGGRRSQYCNSVRFGKSYPAPKEKLDLLALTPPWKFFQDPTVYVFDCERYGRCGVSICYDFLDVERALMYRGEIEHLFVLAYNRDLRMFKALAETLSRTVYCNVVVCNTGVYGGSIAVAPYDQVYRRTIFEHGGQGLFTTQVVALPVLALVQARCKAGPLGSGGDCGKEFKDPPPGVPHAVKLMRKDKALRSAGKNE